MTMSKLSIRVALSLGAGLLVSCGALAQESLVPPNPATPTTGQANAAMLQAVAAFDPADFANATRGKLAELPEAVIKTADGRIAWDARRYEFLAGDPPDTVNPSLWRHQQLNAIAGLFEVTEGIYQFRGYDIANMTLVEGETGWIVIDTMLTAEVARAGLQLAMDHLDSTKPVVAVIYTHSHADHFGGVRGVVDEADVLAGKVKIYAPEGFMEHAIAENVLAGNAMSRRAQYMYGVALPLDPQGTLGTGLGLSLSNGTPGLIPPTDYVTRTGEELVIDGVRIQFQMAHGTEAPAEMMFYFPDKKVLCVSEVANRLMHNVYTIRGAKVRDALLWSKVLNETLDLFPDAEIAMGVHFWPAWGRDDIRSFLTNQRDTYRFIHDRALHLANKGQTKSEIGNADFFPRGLAADASSRGYYGSLSHNMRAVYNFYLGFYDANPATLDPLPRAEVARRYVAALGGEAAVLALGRQAFADGDYRWAVELLNHAVFANPESAAARALQADALEQLGYQAESATWRNAYLMAAFELRNGARTFELSTANPDTVRGMSNELLFDYIALRLDHEKTDGLEASISMVFTDSNETWALELSNSVLNNTRGRVLDNPDLTLRLTRQAFLAMLLQGKTVAELAQAGMIEVDGDLQAFGAIVGNIVDFDPMFNIVTP
jgi:alkyl sulfatase BDS1-like metallo-beta-lactamase superfamily hydrolase